MTKHIFVTGGVVSSLGKGITSASIGRLIKARGLKVSIQKLDPYLNVDPGTMSPYQHGEVFVTEDGAEADLDLGHYERFIDENLSRQSNVTAGQIYWSIVNKERRGDYLGGTVQVIPHVTNEIKSRIRKVAEESACDVLITEVGGTVGDIESLPFLEAIRQLKKDLGHNNVLYVHVTLMPYLKASAELKTKPTQHSVKELRSIGIQPDILVCRSEENLDMDIKKKLALFCDCEADEIISNLDARDIYQVPLLLNEEGLDKILINKLHLGAEQADLFDWKKMVDIALNLHHSVKIAIVGKYVQLPDAYLSVVEALRHGGFFHGTRVEVIWVDAEQIDEAQMEKVLSEVDGVLVPGGFGVRGIEGKIKAIHYARTHHVPFLGICLGLQCVVVEYARNVCGVQDANSAEFDEGTKSPVIDIMHSQREVTEKGGTMRLGAYPCALKEGSVAHKAYGVTKIVERHRHRYEVNNEYRSRLEEKGLVISGVMPEADLVEVVELPKHPFFVATQAHPEFKSRPNRAHPLYRDLVGAALERHKEKNRAFASAQEK